MDTVERGKGLQGNKDAKKALEKPGNIEGINKKALEKPGNIEGINKKGSGIAGEI